MENKYIAAVDAVVVKTLLTTFLKSFTVPVTFFPVTSPVSKALAPLAFA